VWHIDYHIELLCDLFLINRKLRLTIGYRTRVFKRLSMSGCLLLKKVLTFGNPANTMGTPASMIRFK
jgi:hypothetical protein